MIQKVFALRDCKVSAFLQPFFSRSVPDAIRGFEDAVNDPKVSTLTKHPEDFLLYELADFDDSSGEFVCCVPIKGLGCGRDLVKSFPGVPGRVVEESVSNGK